MKLQKDSREFIELLNSFRVEFLVVGGHAVGFHGYPRFTGDLDFWVRPSDRNAGRLVEVLKSFGFSDADNVRDVFRQEQKLLQLGLPPNRIDILTSVSGLAFEEAWQDAVSGHLDGIPVRFPNLESLLRNKEASGRPKDLADIDELKKVARAGQLLSGDGWGPQDSEHVRADPGGPNPRQEPKPRVSRCRRSISS